MYHLWLLWQQSLYDPQGLEYRLPVLCSDFSQTDRHLFFWLYIEEVLLEYVPMGDLLCSLAPDSSLSPTILPLPSSLGISINLSRPGSNVTSLRNFSLIRSESVFSISGAIVLSTPRVHCSRLQTLFNSCFTPSPSSQKN